MANDLNDFIGKMKSLESRLKRSNDLSKTVADLLKTEMSKNLGSMVGIPPEKGGGNDLGSIRTTAKNQIATLTWKGDQIWYLEFGTGIVGAGRYPDGSTMAEANGYSPRPMGHSDGEFWRLPHEFDLADGTGVYSSGWKPYAPFYKTMTQVQNGSFDEEIGKTVDELIERYL